jgi:hypothetical protein
MHLVAGGEVALRVWVDVHLPAPLHHAFQDGDQAFQALDTHASLLKKVLVLKNSLQKFFPKESSKINFSFLQHFWSIQVRPQNRIQSRTRTQGFDAQHLQNFTTKKIQYFFMKKHQFNYH